MIIIDASVATKLINTQEEGSSAAQELLMRHMSAEEKIIVPRLLFIEVANALATKTTLKEAYIEKGIKLLYAAKFVIQEVTERDLVDASIMAQRYGTSVYDMLYAVIAKNKQSTLITCDRKFINKVKLSFIKGLLKE